MTSAWLQAMRAGGPLSCYQGFGVAVLSMAAYKALYFGLYDTAKMLLLPQVRCPLIFVVGKDREACGPQAW